jgi:hypothetical protein
MDSSTATGTKRMIEGRWRVYYDGYWIKLYEPPADTLTAKKSLIQALTRRLFNHVEHGLNIPGTRLEEARRAFDAEIDPAKKRVKGAMLAGALFNRAADVFQKVVELQALGVVIGADNALMQQCGSHLQEALSLGRMVLHRSGEEGIDELWGEPFKAFAFPIEEFYRSRYLKIAQAMRAIDQVAEQLVTTMTGQSLFVGLVPLIEGFVASAKAKCETLHTDAEIFDVWSGFVASGERLSAFKPLVSADPAPIELQRAAEGAQLVRTGKDLISDMTRARASMPKTTAAFVARCEQARREWAGAPATLHDRPPAQTEHGLS